MSRDEHVSGGYYVARLAKRSEQMSSELIPDKVLSASQCICEFFPNAWAIDWTSTSIEERLKRAAAFDVSANDLSRILAWGTESFSKEFGWPNVFYTLGAAQQARAKFLPQGSDIVVFGLGLHDCDVDVFLDAAKPPAPTPGYAPVGETGIFECVNSGERVARGGEAAGFELLATSFGMLTCSWLCNGLERECQSQLGIVPNPHGFVQFRSEASRGAELASRNDAQAEPGLWLPWLVTIYSALPD